MTDDDASLDELLGINDHNGAPEVQEVAPTKDPIEDATLDEPKLHQFVSLTLPFGTTQQHYLTPYRLQSSTNTARLQQYNWRTKSWQTQRNNTSTNHSNHRMPC
jgi:hypothetical protein